MLPDRFSYIFKTITLKTEIFIEINQDYLPPPTERFWWIIKICLRQYVGFVSRVVGSIDFESILMFVNNNDLRYMIYLNTILKLT